MESINGCTNHAGQQFQFVEFANVGLMEGVLNDGPQGLVIDRPSQAAGETRGELLEGRNLKAMATLARGLQT